MHTNEFYKSFKLREVSNELMGKIIYKMSQQLYVYNLMHKDGELNIFCNLNIGPT